MNSWNRKIAVCRAAFAGLSALGCVTSVSAQTVWSFEGSVPSYGEYNAPPPLCDVFPPPPYDVFGPPGGAPCITNESFDSPVCEGGTAFDNNGNILSGGPGFPVLINCDGITLEMLNPDGSYITSGSITPYVCPPVSGVAVDALADIVYLTEGFVVVGVGVPPGPGGGCLPPDLEFGPILLPVTEPVCGLAYDPCTGTLWTCDGVGFVENFTLAGVSLGGFSASPPLFPELTGITVNTTNGNLQVTDGVSVAEFTPAGALVPAGPFYLSANPYPVPVWADRVEGLGFSLRPQNYGRSCSEFGGSGPTIGFDGGYPFAGNTGFSVNQTGAAVGATSILAMSFTFACPSIPFGCGGFWIDFPLFFTLPTGPVPVGGAVTTPLGIPPAIPPNCGIPVGVPLFMQYFNFMGTMMEHTDALAFTIGAA